MLVLVTGTLHRDPEVRTSKTGKQFVTALVRTGKAERTVWANVVAFSTTVQDELLRLGEGDTISLQGEATLTIYTAKDGTPRPSVEIVATQVLALRPDKKPRAVAPAERREAAPAGTAGPDDSIPF